MAHLFCEFSGIVAYRIGVCKVHVIREDVYVAGIDASLRATGICSISPKGIEFATLAEKKLRGSDRLVSVRDRVVRFLGRPIELVSIEGYAYSARGRIAELGEMGGVLKAALCDLEIPIIVITPTQLKKFGTGNGCASKEKVADAVLEKYGVTVEDDNQADAVVLAKISEVYLTGESVYREELDVVHTLRKQKNAKPRKPNPFKYDRQTL